MLALDLGGASTQITFAPTSASQSNFNLNLVSVNTYNLFTYSFLNYGGTEAKKVRVFLSANKNLLFFKQNIYRERNSWHNVLVHNSFTHVFTWVTTLQWPILMPLFKLSALVIITLVSTWFAPISTWVVVSAENQNVQSMALLYQLFHLVHQFMHFHCTALLQTFLDLVAWQWPLEIWEVEYRRFAIRIGNKFQVNTL